MFVAIFHIFQFKFIFNVSFKIQNHFWTEIFTWFILMRCIFVVFSQERIQRILKLSSLTAHFIGFLALNVIRIIYGLVFLTFNIRSRAIWIKKKLKFLEKEGKIL